MGAGLTATLGAAEREALLALARAAIEQRLFGGDLLEPARRALPSTSALDAPRGVFVTLKTSDLRGCIGHLENDRPLREAVERCAVASAFEDPRFDPLSPGEWPRIRLSISALTVPVAIDGPGQVEIGRHGVVLEKGSRRAVFLPQVAPEQGWDVATLLGQLARKAGLPPDGWRDGRLSVFEAEVFGEE
jgi:AmmeMemoRadiSam system protein A